jgi:DNA-binding Lrp family transcriptional regulator
MKPSIEYMSDKLGISVRAIHRAIKELSARGLITYETNKVNHYKFTAIFMSEMQAGKGTGQTGISRPPDPDRMTNQPLTICQTNKELNKQEEHTSCPEPKESLLEINNVNDSSDFSEKGNGGKAVQEDMSKQANTCQQEQTINTVNACKPEYTSEQKRDYALIASKLKALNVIGYQFILKQHGIIRISKALAVIESKPDVINPGAYLRKLLQSEFDIRVKQPQNVKKDTAIEKTKEYLQEWEEIKKEERPKSWEIQKTRDEAVDFLSNFTNMPVVLENASTKKIMEKWGITLEDLKETTP